MFLILLTNGLHYVVMRINYNSDLSRIKRFIGDARLAAWGPKMTRLEGKRKVVIAYRISDKRLSNLFAIHLRH